MEKKQFSTILYFEIMLTRKLRYFFYFKKNTFNTINF